MNRWQCGFWDLSHCSVIGTVTQQHGCVYALTHAHTHTHTHTSKHTSRHTHGPHILCMVTACSLLFGCQYCNTALWLNSWPVCVCLQSVCQPCYDVICSSERQTEKSVTLVKSGKIFPAASRFSRSSFWTATFFLLIHTPYHSLICNLLLNEDLHCQLSLLASLSGCHAVAAMTSSQSILVMSHQTGKEE